MARPLRSFGNAALTCAPDRVEAESRGELCATPRRRFMFLLGAILVLAAFLRFAGLDSQGRHMDEYGQTRAYTLPIRYVVMAAQQQVCQPQLDYVIGWALAKIDQSDWMRRLPSALFGVAGVAACALLGRRLVSWPVGLIAALLLAVSPLHWSLSRIARPYTICVAALMLMLWTLARALDRPDRRRLFAYAGAAYLMTLTRSLLPLVVLLATGLILTAPVLWSCRRVATGTIGAEQASKRVWIVTVIVALAAIPMPSALLPGHNVPLTVFGTLLSVCNADFGIFAPPVVPFWPTLAANTVAWTSAGKVMFGGTFPVIIALAAIGVLMIPWKWGELSGGARRTLLVMVGTGPLYLVVFSAIAPRAKMMVAYGVFVVPILAILTATALTFGLEQIQKLLGTSANSRNAVRLPAPLLYKEGLGEVPSRSKNPPRSQLGKGGGESANLFGNGTWLNVRKMMISATAFVVATFALAFPALSLVRSGYDPLYRRADWRGCARYLEDRVDSQDVIMTFEDRPLGPGWSQPNYWGKHDWPQSMDKPLAESAWTLVSSESHWQRLLSKNGRCFIVVKNLDGDTALRESDPSPGITHTKFHGLDLMLRPQPHTDAPTRLIQACDDLIALPKRFPRANAFLYVLRSRLQLHAGDVAAAVDSFEQAERLVGQDPNLKKWFALAADPHANVLARAVDGIIGRSG